MNRPCRPSIILPSNKELDWERGHEVVQKYLSDQSAALALYDGTIEGPHDEILPIDVLALNALNAFAGTSPMTPMEAIWRHAEQRTIQPLVAAITTRNIEDLSDSEVEIEASKVCGALAEIDKTKGFGGGGTRTSKLLHRLRPNIVPIWDAIVGEWYGGARQSWPDYVRATHAYVRRPENLAFLKSQAASGPYKLGLLRVWDILLWKLKYDKWLETRRS